MNKVFNINLGNSPLTIDEDAYRFLENYLQSLHNHFRQSEGYDEIMNDIEARLGELIQEGMAKRTIASMQDVKNAVSVMGTPEDFGAQSIDSQQDTHKKSENTEGASSKGSFFGGIKTGKRLFRDEQNCQVGGVCSGMSAYFGISDPIWMRIAFLGMFFMWGTGVGLYILLWIVIPAAKNAGDRLAMKGAPIDVNSIAKTVEEGVEQLSQKMNALSNPEGKAQFNSQISQVSSHVGDAVRNILRGLGGIGKFVGIGASIFIIFITVVVLISLIIGSIWAFPFFGYVSDAYWFGPLALFNGFWIIAIPALSIILFIRRLLYKRQVSGMVSAGIWGFFTLNIISLSLLAGVVGKDFNQETTITQQISIQNPTANVLNLETMSKPYDELHTSLGDLRISDDYITSENVWGSIVKSDGTQFELTRRINSNGRNTEEAYRLANAIEAKYEVQGDNVNISKFFKINKGTKWRGQSIEYVLKMPVGKRIKKIKNGVYPIIDWNPNEWVEDDDNNNQYEEDDIEEIYEMTDKGLKRVGKKIKKEEE
jgi:phage shock protein PspC (stress-responsive transcriptional regulator)